MYVCSQECGRKEKSEFPTESESATFRIRPDPLTNEQQGDWY